MLLKRDMRDKIKVNKTENGYEINGVDFPRSEISKFKSGKKVPDNTLIIKCSEFLNNDYAAYAMYNTYRKLASYVDGLKPSARKIIWCVEKNNINKPTIKVASLANKTTDESEYLHGSVNMEDVCIGLCQDYPGTNNINLLKPSGSFGNRTIHEAAPSRYIYTCKEKYFDEIFDPNDRKNLTEQQFEGTVIEPKYFIPSLPLILINGSEGVGNGFAQKILPRNPTNIIKSIKNTFDNKTRVISKIPPYYKGFNGDIIWSEEESNWWICGKFERLNKTTISITELPIDYSLSKYRKILEKLEDDKIIVSFNDESENNTFKFEIKVNREFTAKDDAWIMKTLKLISKVSENFTCIDENNAVIEFKSEHEILSAYCRIREQYYQKRKEYLLDKQNKELIILNAKYHFVKLIMENKIIVFKKSKADIESQIRARKEFANFEDINTLISMPIHSFTTETFESLNKQIEDKKVEIETTDNTTIKEMWVKDLNEVEKMLK